LASTHRLTSLDGVSCVSALDTYLRVRQRQSNHLHTRVDTKAAAWTARKTVRWTKQGDKTSLSRLGMACAAVSWSWWAPSQAALLPVRPCATPSVARKPATARHVVSVAARASSSSTSSAPSTSDSSSLYPEGDWRHAALVHP